jgi:lysophospholipase L1-like esterase
MHSLLSLGDSYTIGEGVPLYDSYPYQAVQLLRQSGHPFFAPEIIARTGWTTHELAAALQRIRLLPRYDFVTLLIGVNNQYRGLGIAAYASEFEELLQLSIRLAASPSHVFVLSIPCWSVTPFAAHNGRDPHQIAREIDAFNEVAQKIARLHGQPFIDITAHSRTVGSAPDAFVADGLHPGPAQYAHWALRLANFVSGQLAQHQ